ncbi:hypothetical protein SAM23877_6502 [Streptomyces ambofaciens ATCC 23877]|uniref:Uncharacterized protein n=1 Tax=Streptomyces ambofaciens (strain ATCC 23877 / 3486 / DSM 40053 / JCM 4204 / NBRC 12836 / NRRL B-2516) TaxID=278992 RepID=A0AE69_STRA7|nr:hypothetical protein [Streptomyces ambofaciens]AKZ59547.1 hypothetical protein SAM23877_6502 [Streptomyces ambofaciens ATCC 23877]CAJ88778.1 hypothetical protein SAMR1069 [Streptomyces ambofaciens ATCC 23877]
MAELAAVRAQEYATVYDELIEAAARLDMLRRLEGNAVDAHATAAMHAVRFAATMLWPVAPEGTPQPGFRHDTAWQVQLIAKWREAALEIGPFEPERPVLRVVTDGQRG